MVGVWVQSPNTWARCTCSIFIQRLQHSPALAHKPFSLPVWAQCHQAYYKKIRLAHLIPSFIYFMWPLVCVCLETKTVSQDWNWRSTVCSHIFWVAGFLFFFLEQYWISYRDPLFSMLEKERPGQLGRMLDNEQEVDKRLNLKSSLDASSLFISFIIHSSLYMPSSASSVRTTGTKSLAPGPVHET